MGIVWSEHGAEIAVEPCERETLRLSVANRFEAGPTWRVSVEFTPGTAEELAAALAGWLLELGWTLPRLAELLSPERRP